MSYNLTLEKIRKITDYPEFERLCCEVLNRQGYDRLNPQGIEGKDGGKDALHYDESSKVEFHFSTRQDWKPKVKKDTKKTYSSDRECDKIVFVSNQVIQGTQEDKIKEEIEEDYRYSLEVYDAERLRLLLDSVYQDLREKYLRIETDPQHTTNDSAKLEDFHNKRIEKITNEDLKIDYSFENAIIIHLAPLDSFNNSQRVDTASFTDKHKQLSPPMRHRQSSYEIVSDGIFFREIQKGETKSYVKLFRNGVIELVYGGHILNGRDETIPTKLLEVELVRSLTNYIEFYRDQSMPLPIYINSSFIGLKGLKIPRQKITVGPDPKINENEIKTNSSSIKEYDEDHYTAIEDTIDRLYNAAGLKQSKYKKDGCWDLRETYERKLERKDNIKIN